MSMSEDNMKKRMIRDAVVLLTVCATLLSCLPAHAAREAVGSRDGEKGGYGAFKLLRRGEELLAEGHTERGIKMLETVVEQNPKGKVRFMAYLALGRHYIEARDNAKAVEKLRLLANLKKKDEELTGKDLEMYLEGSYLNGVAHFNARQYAAAFAVLRKITSGYPNTMWANQAYYYIGMSHFAQKHWSKAINNLSLVGTFIDPESPEVEYVEAGHRFYAKIDDGDLPILRQLGKDVTVVAEAASGDKETMLCKPQSAHATVFVGSARTAVGTGTPGDGVLHLVGGDMIDVKYYDDSTKAGEKDVLRQKKVKVASTGALTFTRGTYKLKTGSAFLEQPIYLRVKDIDHDTTATNDTLTVRVASTYIVKEEEVDDTAPEMTVDIDKLLAETDEEDKVRIRSEIELALTEDAGHSGVFVGKAFITRAAEEGTQKTKPGVLACAVGDTLVATYVDTLTIVGEGLTEVKDELTVYDEIDALPRADQDVVAEAITKARKQIVEAEAYLEIARIFQSMGLKKGAKAKSEEGLERVKFAIQTAAAIPPSLRERAFNIKWDLYLAQDHFPAAMGTCNTFSKLFPESPLVDKALMGIGRIHLERGSYRDAIEVFKQVAKMPTAPSAAEAMFLVAETTEKMGIESANKSGDAELAAKGAQMAAERSAAAYKACAERYPDSEYAGRSLAKVVDFHILTKDFRVADDILTQIFIDYQDGDFLDSMLLKWVRVAFDMGDIQKSYDKCDQLLSEYPESVHAQKAQKILPTLEKKLGIGGEEPEEEDV